MFLTGKRQNDFYIELNDSRYFYPGDVVRGSVVLDLAKPTKTNFIKVTFLGEAQAEGTTLQLFSKSWYMATSTDENQRAHILEAQTHRFPFQFEIPHEDPELPSSAQIPKLGGIKYSIVALHDKPFVLEAMSPQTRTEITVLERIDVTDPEYCVKGEYIEDIVPVDAQENEKVRVLVSVPKLAIVRGDIMPITITLKHYRAMSKEQGVKIELIRRAYFGKIKSHFSEQKAINTTLHDIEVSEENTYKQVFVTKLMIPTSTPPTIMESGRIIRIEYIVKVRVNLNEWTQEECFADNPRNTLHISIPIILGTYPKPDLQIEEDEMDEMDGDGVEERVLKQSSLEERVQSIALDDHGSIEKHMHIPNEVDAFPAREKNNPVQPSHAPPSINTSTGAETEETESYADIVKHSVHSPPHTKPSMAFPTPSMAHHHSESRAEVWAPTPSMPISFSSVAMPSQPGGDGYHPHHNHRKDTSPLLQPAYPLSAPSDYQRDYPLPHSSPLASHRPSPVHNGSYHDYPPPAPYRPALSDTYHDYPPPAPYPCPSMNSTAYGPSSVPSFPLAMPTPYFPSPQGSSYSSSHLPTEMPSYSDTLSHPPTYHTSPPPLHPGSYVSAVAMPPSPWPEYRAPPSPQPYYH